MYNDLADAVEDLKEKGISTYKVDKETGQKIRSGDLEPLKGIRIVETHRFDTNRTNPEDESTLYVIELPDRTRKYMILGFGMNEDPAKTDFIDELLKMDQS